MIKVGEWVLTTGGKVVFNEKDGRYSFKNKKEAMDFLKGEYKLVSSTKGMKGKYFIRASKFAGTINYTLTKVTESNLNRVMSMLEDN